MKVKSLPEQTTPLCLQQMLERLGKYQELYFKQTGDLYENIEQLGNNFYNIMLADLVRTYKDGSEILTKISELEIASATYEIKCRESFLKPARRPILFWKRNEPADIIFREINVDITKYFRERTEALERLEAALDKADNADHRPTVFDEPEQTEPTEIATKSEQGSKPTAADSTLSADSGTPPRIQEQGTQARKATKSGK